MRNDYRRDWDRATADGRKMWNGIVKFTREIASSRLCLGCPSNINVRAATGFNPSRIDRFGGLSYKWLPGFAGNAATLATEAIAWPSRSTRVVKVAALRVDLSGHQQSERQRNHQ